MTLEVMQLSCGKLYKWIDKLTQSDIYPQILKMKQTITNNITDRRSLPIAMEKNVLIADPEQQQQ